MCFLARKRSLRWPSWIKACGLCFSGVVPASRPRVHGVLSQKAISIKPRDRGFESHSEQLFLKIPLPSVFACRHKKREKLLGLCLQIRARIRRRSEKKSEPDCRADGEKSNGNDSLFSLHKETRQQNGAPKSATLINYRLQIKPIVPDGRLFSLLSSTSMYSRSSSAPIEH